MLNLVKGLAGVTLGVGGVGVFVYSSVGGGGSKELVLSRVDQPTRPLFSCVGDKDFRVVDVSIAFREDRGSSQGKKLYWKGFDWKSRQNIDLEQIISSHDSTWQLTILEKTGKTRLGTLSGHYGDSYDDQLYYCNENVFKVTQWTYETPIDSKQFEKGFNKIVLTLDSCKAEEGKKECNLKISEGIGLEWSHEFEPKVTLLV